MSPSPRPDPVDPIQHPDRPDPLEDTMDTDPQPGTRPDDDPTRVFDIPEASEATGRRGPRVGTVVWGLVIAAVGVGVLALAAGLVFDVELALITLVAAAGAALLIGSLITGIRRSGR